MADFLARLSARALGVGPVARPRVRALFESSPDALAPPPTTSMETDAVEASTQRIAAPADRTGSDDATLPVFAVSSSANPASPTLRSATQPATPAAASATAAVAVDARGSRDATPLRPNVFPPPNDRESEFHRPRQPAPTPIVAAETAREPVSPPGGTREPSREPSLPPVVAPAALSGRDPDGEPGRSSRETRPAVSTVVARADEATVSRHAADAPAERGPTPMEARDRSFRGVRYGDHPAAEQAPVVRVTIGRVEVRAVMPTPPPAPRPAPRSSFVSLDDYLKSPTRN